MAYDKPLKMQWIEVDGRTVPLVLPQYWSDEQDDWVVSSEQNRLPVDAQLTGSKVEQKELFSTAFSSGVLHTTEWESALDGKSVGLLVDSDTPIEVRLEIASDSAGSHPTTDNKYRFVVDPTDRGAIYVPPARVGAYYRWVLKNPTGVDATRTNIFELKYYGAYNQRQFIRALLIDDAEIRDTSNHTPFDSGDSEAFYVFRISLLGDGVHPIFVRNDLDVEITVGIQYTVAGGYGASIGEFTIAAGGSVAKTNQDFAGLDIPTYEMFLRVKASSTPTSGVVGAYTITGSGA